MTMIVLKGSVSSDAMYIESDKIVALKVFDLGGGKSYTRIYTNGAGEFAVKETPEEILDIIEILGGAYE